MNAPLDIRMDNAAFLQWVQGREGRFELERGRVMQQMAGRPRNHAILVVRLAAEFINRLDGANWTVCATELAVEIAGSVRYPDVLVERSGGAGSALATTEPVLLVEVLSPSSVLRDLKTKLAEYTTLPSLEVYIVASQDEPIVWIWQRSRDEAREFQPEPQEINGRAEAIAIEAFGVSTPLADLYRGIGH